MSLDQRGERRKQRRMREREALHTFVLGDVPGLGQIFERQLPRFALLGCAVWVELESVGFAVAHETQLSLTLRRWWGASPKG